MPRNHPRRSGAGLPEVAGYPGRPASKAGRTQREFRQRELLAYIDFFDSVESKPLTDEQRKAAVIMETAAWLIAAAGSGKSSTVVAKIGYAIKTGLCQPNEILAVVFNRNAREELEARLTKRLPEHGPRSPPAPSTSWARTSSPRSKAEQPRTPAPWEDGPRPAPPSLSAWWKVCSTIQNSSATGCSFAPSVSGPTGNWLSSVRRRVSDRYLREVGEERDGHRGILTLNGELVRSMEEVAIANWLYLNGVNYQYERAYEFETADRQHRQYFPDFYYPDIELYHEHFALDDNGKPPPLLKGDYEQGVIWKRALHTDKGTALIETTSAMYRQGELFAHLKQELESRGVVFHHACQRNPGSSQPEADQVRPVPANLHHASEIEWVLTRSPADQGRRAARSLAGNGVSEGLESSGNAIKRRWSPRASSTTRTWCDGRPVWSRSSNCLPWKAKQSVEVSTSGGAKRLRQKAVRISVY